MIAAKSILQSSYTREAETAADAYGAGLMNKAGGDARALAVILDKIGGATEPGMKILLNHPETRRASRQSIDWLLPRRLPLSSIRQNGRRSRKSVGPRHVAPFLA